LVLLGLISCEQLFAGMRGNVPAAGPPPGADDPPPPPPEPETGCQDDLSGFQAFAGPQSGPRRSTLDSVTLVCWEPTGALRVESKLSPDINVNAESVTWLCQTLAGQISRSGRPWKGFTVYSKHPAFDGQPMLAGRTPGGACTKPQR
jgi:hypothetical protein